MSLASLPALGLAAVFSRLAQLRLPSADCIVICLLRAPRTPSCSGLQHVLLSLRGRQCFEVSVPYMLFCSVHPSRCFPQRPAASRRPVLFKNKALQGCGSLGSRGGSLGPAGLSGVTAVSLRKLEREEPSYFFPRRVTFSREVCSTLTLVGDAACTPGAWRGRGRAPAV